SGRPRTPTTRSCRRPSCRTSWQSGSLRAPVRVRRADPSPSNHSTRCPTFPINCVEPRICPHTRGPRSWSMPVALRDYAKREASGGHDVEVAVLHCRHRSYGVGMFDTREVLDADERIAAAVERGPAEAVIGTVSHCHGALTRVLIGGLRAEAGSRDR